MCDIQAALQVAGAVVSHRQKKADNKAIRRDQKTTRRNADKAYLHDLNKIDQEKVSADREKVLAEIRTKAKRDGEIAQKVNLGNANSTKIVQSLGALYDEDWVDITRGYDKDIQLFQNQQTDGEVNQENNSPELPNLQKFKKNDGVLAPPSEYSFFIMIYNYSI